MFDQSVIEKIKNGDEEKLSAIYRAYRNDFIYWAVRNYGCTEEAAKDVFQVSIVIFYENIMSGKLVSLHSSVKTYLFAIGKNKLMEGQVAQRKQQHIQDNFKYEAFEGSDDSSELENKEEIYHNLEAALQELGEPCKTVLNLFYYQNKGIDEIAAALHYKGNDSAKTQKYKCLMRLKKIFAQQKTGPLPS
jgi:RNA polymerase sigma-70 factor (ECF subfamily)